MFYIIVHGLVMIENARFVSHIIENLSVRVNDIGK